MASTDVVPIRTPAERARRRQPVPASVEVEALEFDLRAQLDGEVRFDAGSRALYATDASNYRQVPIGVVIPRHKVDVMATIDVCRKHGAPILSRGGGTSLAGPVLQRRRGDGHVEVPATASSSSTSRAGARACTPGTCSIRCARAATPHDLTFGPDPATHNHCTLGGMIGNNSCGVHSVIAGRTADNVHELEILTYDGLVHAGRRHDPRGAGGDHPGRRAPGPRSTASSSSSCDRYGELVRAAVPEDPAPRLRATTSTSCSPRTASTSRARWSAPRRPA